MHQAALTGMALVNVTAIAPVDEPVLVPMALITRRS